MTRVTRFHPLPLSGKEISIEIGCASLYSNHSLIAVNEDHNPPQQAKICKEKAPLENAFPRVKLVYTQAEKKRERETVFADIEEFLRDTCRMAMFCDQLPVFQATLADQLQDDSYTSLT